MFLRYPWRTLALPPGTRLGPYEIVAPIGAGGMGEVYRGRDTRLDRDVAIKVLPPHLSESPAMRERFDREARAISKVTHPYICTLYDVGHQDGVDFLVMEYLEGETLADILRRGPLPLSDGLRYGSQIADALDHAHRLGIMHRDLKPGNVMITKSGVKVLDFGLAKPILDETAPTDATQQKPLTEEGMIVGTPQYMAPEQLEGRDAGARTDIFAAGLILYEMTTGRPAFQGQSRASLIAAIMERDPAPIEGQPALDSVIRRCLAKKPDDRLQSARDLDFALQQIAETNVGRALQPVHKGGLRARPTFVVIAIAALVLIAAGVWMATHRHATPSHKSVAVLPFANLGIDRSREYLRLAIPDEITTILSYAPGLSVRPFSVSRRLTGDVDPRDAAKQLNASEVVSGHLLDENGKLSVTLEAIDASDDKLLWHDVFEVPSADLITMRHELTARIRDGLLPRLAGSAGASERSGPRNAEAYTLYLRSTAMSTDPVPNKEALQLLDQAVRLDPSYAPAWAAVATRSYYDSTYADGGAAALARAQETAHRALQLDPNLIEAATRLVIMRTEAGDIAHAVQDAKALVARRPDSSEAHATLGYALRYAGALGESASECNIALSIDGGNRGVRSCALTFEQLGDYDRSGVFAGVDAGSSWNRLHTGSILIKTGHLREALPLLTANQRRLVTAAAAHAPELDRLTDEVAEQIRSRTSDGEPFYFVAADLSAAGAPEQALRLLRLALQRNYCAVPAIDRDPALAAVRKLPEYAQFRAAAQQCRERVLGAIPLSAETTPPPPRR